VSHKYTWGFGPIEIKPNESVTYERTIEKEFFEGERVVARVSPWVGEVYLTSLTVDGQEQLQAATPLVKYAGCVVMKMPLCPHGKSLAARVENKSAVACKVDFSIVGIAGETK
jgi:hypothetical protein